MNNEWLNAYVLHRRPYRETSYIVDFFTLEEIHKNSCADFKIGITLPNNEVHLLVECSHFQTTRDGTALGALITLIRVKIPGLSNLALYKILLDDSKPYQRPVSAGLFILLEEWKKEVAIYMAR